MIPTVPMPRRELVLVGGGHTHVQVLRRLAMEPLPLDVRTTLVVDTPIAVYSGMVPGFVAGQYRADELEIDVVPLARRARARVVLAPALGLDPKTRRLFVEGRPALPYDLVSFDVGSTVAGLDLPGVRKHALATRPIGRFVGKVDAWLRSRPADAPPPRVAVVGAGAGGVELAFALRHRLARPVPSGSPFSRQGEGGRGDEDSGPEVTLVEAGPRILPGSPPSLVARAERWAKRKGIAILTGREVRAVDAERLLFADGSELAADLVAWVTGAVAPPVFEGAGLALDDRGFLLVRPTLQAQGDDAVFAVGDCATLADFPETPKAGVYAVRQGPYLVDNLRAAFTGGTLRRYRPQRDFLALLNLGDGPVGRGRALGAKWGVAFEGRWVLRLKDRIDRKFMRRFQVLGTEGDLAPDFQGGMTMPPMLCGGCAAKLGETALGRALARLGTPPVDPAVALGLADGDDAAAVRTPGGELVVVSVDAFRAFTDDPWLVGAVAAVNATSDLWAKGATPRWALAVVGVPEDEDERAAEETLVQVLAGARSVLDAAGVALVGGHTTTGPGLTVGFTVGGTADEDALLRRAGLAPGQLLVLSKALGTGVLLHADGGARARGPWLEAAIASMLRPNADAARIARAAGATAATDVTGFGLAGHAAGLARASGVAIELDVAALPALPGALELLARGFRSTFHPENARLRRGMDVDPAAAADPRVELLFDPQTSGGLLFGVDAERAGEVVAELRHGGDVAACVVGRVVRIEAGGAPLRVSAGVEGATGRRGGALRHD